MRNSTTNSFAFSILLISAACAALGFAVFATWYGSGAIYHPDTLQAEELYSDIFLHGGSLAQWSLPYSSYWLDFGLYALIRSFVPVQVATPAFSACLAILLALSSWFAVYPMADSPMQKRLTGLACCALALFICTGNAYSYLMSRVLFHVITAVFVCISVGCFIRILSRSPGLWVYGLLCCGIAASSASDTMFVLWFVIPACGLVAALFLLKKLPLGHAVAYIAMLVFPVLVGKMADAMFKPEYSQVAGHIKPALRRIIPTLTVFLRETYTYFSSTPLTIFLGFASILTVVVYARQGKNRLYLALIALLAACTIAGYAVNGATAAWYIVPLWSFLLLLTLAFAFSQMPTTVAALACIVLTAISVTHIWPQLTKPLHDYRPSYTTCLATVAKEHGIREALAFNDFAKETQYLSGLNISTAPIRSNYFLFARTLTTPHGKPLEAPLLILPNAFSDEMFRLETLYAINGQPERIVECPGTQVSLYLYPNGARIGTMADYFGDTAGHFEKSFPKRDMNLWRGSRDVAGITIKKASSLYRLNRQWIVLQLDAKAERLRNKRITLYMAGDKDNALRRFAGNKLSQTGSSPLDYLWKKLAWSETFTLGTENTFPAPDGNGSWFFFRSPDRETKKWQMLAVDSENEFTRLF